MKLGIRAHDLPIFNDVDQLAAELHKLNFSYVQFAPRVSLDKLTDSGKNVSFGLADSVRKTFARNKISIAVLGCYVNIIHPDLKLRAKNCQQFEKYLSLASSFGSALVATETGSVDPNFNFTKENWDSKIVEQTINEVRNLTDTAAKLGCLVGIEPGINHPIHSVGLTKRLLQEVSSPNLKIILDPANLVYQASDQATELVAEAIENFGESIYAFHLKDYAFKAGKKVVTPIGTGDAAISEMVKIIADFQCEPYVILDETPQKDFKQSLINANQIIDKL